MSELWGSGAEAGAGAPSEVSHREGKHQRQRAEDRGGGGDEDCGIGHKGGLQRMMVFVLKCTPYDTIVSRIAQLFRALRAISGTPPAWPGPPRKTAAVSESPGQFRPHALRWPAFSASRPAPQGPAAASGSCGLLLAKAAWRLEKGNMSETQSVEAGPPLCLYIRAVSDRRRRAQSRHPLWG